MKVEKDLGFVNEIPVYVNGKKSNLRVGKYAYDAAVEEVLENTKESFQKPLTVAGQSKTYYVVAVKTTMMLFGRDGKIINVHVHSERIPNPILSGEIRKIEAEFFGEIDGEITRVGFKELEEFGAVCGASKTTFNNEEFLKVAIDFSGISEATEEEIEEMKVMMTQMDALKIEAEQAIKENMFIDDIKV